MMAPPTPPLERDPTVDNFHARDRFPITQKYNGQIYISSQSKELWQEESVKGSGMVHSSQGCPRSAEDAVFRGLR